MQSLPNIGVTQTNDFSGFLSTGNDKPTFTKTIQHEGKSYVLTITFSATDNQNKADFLKKFDSIISEKIVKAAIIMGLGVPTQKPAKNNKPIREYTITSFQFFLGNDKELRVRKAKTIDGVDEFKTKNLQEIHSEDKKQLLNTIKSVFTENFPIAESKDPINHPFDPQPLKNSRAQSEPNQPKPPLQASNPPNSQQPIEQAKPQQSSKTELSEAEKYITDNKTEIDAKISSFKEKYNQEPQKDKFKEMAKNYGVNINESGEFKIEDPIKFVEQYKKMLQAQ